MVDKVGKGWSLAGLFVIALVISMPFYSASVYAGVNVQITKNEGEAELEGFLDADGDVWTVEALLNGVGTGNAEGNVSGASNAVDPNSVVVKIGNHEAPFGSCSDGPLGVTCKYISPLTDGIKEAQHDFQVVYTESSLGTENKYSDEKVISADGSAPSITGINAKQVNEGWVEFDFVANDKVNVDAPSIGIKRIEILDSETGDLLKTLGDFELGKYDKYHYALDSGFSNKLDVPFEGEGWKRIKLKAEDFLGHATYSPVISFRGDFVKPEIVADSLNFTQFGEFIGEFIGKTDIVVKVIETNEVKVEASSSQVDLDGDEGDCTEDADEPGLWECRWNGVNVDPESSISVKIVATDIYSNSIEKTITKTFTKDISPPKIDFFGSERTYGGQSYVRTDEQRIVLKVKEQGAGISSSGIRANLGALEKSFTEPPTACNQTIKGIDCYWETFAKLSSDGIAVINLETFEDNVGNDGEFETVELIVDNTGPTVKSFNIYGFDGNEDKNYFSSADVLRIKLRAAEVSGLVVLVNLDEVVMDAETKYPLNELNREVGAGWMAFTEDDCNRNDDNEWVCEFDTDPIKSGDGGEVSLEIKVQDTAGNDAKWVSGLKVNNAKDFDGKDGKQGTFDFDLLGLSTEESPDYWEVSSVNPKVRFVDLDAVPYTFTRIPINVRFRSSSPNVKLLAVDLPPGNCVPADTGYNAVAAEQAEVSASAAPATEVPTPVTEEEAAQALAGAATAVAAPVVGYPEVSRNLLYQKNYASGKRSPAGTTLILEFAPFDGKAMFNLGETKGDFDEVYAEYICKFKLYSKVGKEAVRFPEYQEVQVSVPFAFTALGSKDENIDKLIADIKDDVGYKIPDKLKWLNKIIQWVRYLSGSINLLLKIATILESVSGTGDDWRYDLPTYTVPAAALFCTGTSAIEREVPHKIIGTLQKVVQVFSCNPSAISNNWYGAHQQSVINFFNAIKSAGMRKTVSLYDNIWISVIGLCIPGILYNLEKLRQIKCVKINCLENYVPQGITTVDGCAKTSELLECKYYWGELITMFIPSGTINIFTDFIKNLLTNPIGLVKKAVSLGCSIAFCPGSNKGNEFCTYAGVLVFAIDVVDNILGLVDSYPSMNQDYCSQVGEGGWS